MLEPNRKIRDLIWQLELIVKVHPDIVRSALAESEIQVDLYGTPAVVTKAILEFFFESSFSGLTKFLSSLCSNLSIGKPDLVVTGVINSLLLLLLLCSDDELYSIAEGDYDFHSQSCGAETFFATSSGVEVGFTRLFDPLSLHKYALTHSTQNPERDGQTKRIVLRLVSDGPYRKFSFPGDTLSNLEQLKSKVANFEAVIDYIQDAVAVSIRFHSPIKITPILLVGEAGIGKSYFTNQLSRSLGVPSRRVAMDNIQVGSGLSGSSFIYSNSETGAVFKVLTQEDHVSPLVILDEIDKANSSSFYEDPLSPLHNLLEPLSAKMFEDASFTLALDASHVIWIATANRTDKIPTTILSRFEIFEICSQSPLRKHPSQLATHRARQPATQTQHLQPS